MKKIRYFRYILLITMMLVGTAFSMAQNLCEEKCEGCEEEGSTEYSAEIGGEEGEMGLAEADMMGTEAGGEAGGEALAEMATELSTEFLATLPLDAIPGVGEIVMLAFLEQMLINLYTIERQAREHETANILSGGKYSFPLFPSFSLAAEDLDGTKDRVSYLIFIDKVIDSKNTKKYLENLGLTTHINQTYSLNNFTDHVSYAFSEFTSYTATKDPERRRVPVRYKRTIPRIQLTKSKDGKLNYKYSAMWRHDQDYNRSILTFGSEGEDHPRQFRYTRTWNYSLHTSFRSSYENVAEFWLATINSDGTFNYRQQVPSSNISFEDAGKDRLAIRISEFNIHSHSTLAPLYITLRIRCADKYIISNGEKMFPENWDPTQADSRYTYTYYNEMPNEGYGPSFSTKIAFEDSGIYPNTRGMAPDVNKFVNLLIFKVHDYQPKDTDATASAKVEARQVADINPFPLISSSGVTQYLENRVVSAPDLGKTNLRFDIKTCLSESRKLIDYIELECLTNGHTSIVNLSNYTAIPNSSTPLRLVTCDISAHYNNAGSSKNPLEVTPLIYQRDDAKSNPLYSLSDNLVLNFSRCSASFLLKNAPVAAGDVVNVSTYYTDGSVSRDVVLIKAVSNNTLPRAYYYIREGATARVHGNTYNYLHYNENDGDGKLTLDPKIYSQSGFIWEIKEGGVESKPVKPGSSWLIEYQGNGTYAIMHKDTKKVLGIVGGKLGLYHWEHNNYELLWHLEFDDAGKVKLFNMNQHAFLSVPKPTTRAIPGFSFSNGNTFSLTREADAEAILPENLQYLYNKSVNKLLDIDKEGNPALTLQQGNNSHNQTNKLKYMGCLSYAIYQNHSQKYLNYTNKNGLEWDDSVQTPWLLTKGYNYFTLKSKGRPLYRDANLETQIGVDLSDNPDISKRKYHFSFVGRSTVSPQTRSLAMTKSLSLTKTATIATEHPTGKLKIYPNPMTGETYIEFPNENNSSYRLQITDASGRVVYIRNNVKENKITIARKHVKSSGLHLIILSGEKIYKGKLMVK